MSDFRLHPSCAYTDRQFSDISLKAFRSLFSSSSSYVRAFDDKLPKVMWKRAFPLSRILALTFSWLVSLPDSIVVEGRNRCEQPKKVPKSESVRLKRRDVVGPEACTGLYLFDNEKVEQILKISSILWIQRTQAGLP